MKLVEFKEVTTISVYFKNGQAQTFELEEEDTEREGGGTIYFDYKGGRQTDEIQRDAVAFLRRFKRKVPVNLGEEPEAATAPNPDASPSGGDLL